MGVTEQHHYSGYRFAGAGAGDDPGLPARRRARPPPHDRSL